MIPGLKTFIDACVERGMPICPDNNSGNPIGVSLAQFNVRGGERSYSANAFLDREMRRSLINLTVVTSTACDQIIFEGRRARAVRLYSHTTKQTSTLFLDIKHVELTVCSRGAVQQRGHCLWWGFWFSPAPDVVRNWLK